MQDEFDSVKSDAMLGAFVAIGFAMARQVALLAPDPAQARAYMRTIALRMLAHSDDVRPAPADGIARHLVETVFLS